MTTTHIIPGVYEIPAEQYFSGPGISRSELDCLLQSPLHYWDRYLNPERVPEKETAALRIGHALHTAILEPHLFTARYACAPEGIDRRTKEGKARWTAFLAENAGKTPLNETEFKRVTAMGDAVRAHPTSAKLFITGAPERTVYWTDQETGILCRCRPDWLRPSLIADFKTCEDASMASFQRSIFEYAYHRQVAWYLDGVAAVTGEQHGNFIFIAIEKSRPYAVAHYIMDDEAIALGRKENRRALEVYQRCQQTNEWPGYPLAVQTITLPAYAFRNA